MFVLLNKTDKVIKLAEDGFHFIYKNKNIYVQGFYVTVRLLKQSQLLCLNEGCIVGLIYAIRIDIVLCSL